jgi:hypothetical protein
MGRKENLEKALDGVGVAVNMMQWFNNIVYCTVDTASVKLPRRLDSRNTSDGENWLQRTF